VSVSDPVVPAPPPRSSTKTIVIATIIVIVAFVSGGVAGILLDHLHFMHRGPHPPRMIPRMMVNRLAHSLDLTPEQRVKVEEIIERHHRRISELTDGVRPQVHRELEAANAEIEAVLTPEQREKFAKMKMRLGHREGRSRRGPTR
jgi:Spy/CpxP family protein refolding chaperone